MRVLLVQLEGGAVHATDRDGAFLLEIDECSAVDLLDESDRDGLEPNVTLSFATRELRDDYARSRGWMRPATDEVPRLVGQLYGVVRELESLFGRKFTPDGHLIGSIGEVIAAHRYGLELLPHSNCGYDATYNNSLCVEIKASQCSAIGLRAAPPHLIVLHLSKSGEATEIFNGPGQAAWEAAGPQQKNGQRQVSFRRLRGLMQEIPHDERIPELGQLGEAPSARRSG